MIAIRASAPEPVEPVEPGEQSITISNRDLMAMSERDRLKLQADAFLFAAKNDLEVEVLVDPLSYARKIRFRQH